MTLKELLKIIGLGMAIWALSLVWPEINGVLTPRVTLGLMAGLGAAGLAHILSQHSNNHRPPQHQARREHSSRPTLALRPR
jgi:hypothetical protein